MRQGAKRSLGFPRNLRNDEIFLVKSLRFFDIFPILFLRPGSTFFGGLMFPKFTRNLVRATAIGFPVFAAFATAAGILATRAPLGARVLLLLACYAMLALGYLTIRRSISVIRGVAGDMVTVVDAMNRNSAGLTEISRSISEGASQESESVEQACGTTDLMVSITRQSSESGRTAVQMMEDTHQLANRTAEDLEQMVGSIHRNRDSAAKIAQITKVVDEIAFQTNILALNAAIEAARAGESGAGFAVVAEEVRRLAQRSAQAAGDIARLVEESVANTLDGVSRLDSVAGTVRGLIEHTGSAQTLVKDFTSSSDELALAMEHVSSTIRAVQKIIGQTSDDSRQTAMTSQEIGERAQVMTGLLTSLREVAG